MIKIHKMKKIYTSDKIITMPLTVLMKYLVLMLLMLSLFSVEALSAAEDSTNEFISIDVTDTVDGKAFALKMDNLGWVNRGEGQTLYDPDSKTIWDYDKNEPNVTPKNLMDAGVPSQADIMYVGSHGYPNGDLTYKVTHEDDRRVIIAKSHPFSPWDEDLEWVIFASCSVLNVDFDSNGWPSGPGVEWAKALRGKNNPAHAILGYYGGAPGEGTDRIIAEKFVDSLGSKRIIVAWKDVNKPYPTTWACIVNKKNEIDTLTSVTSDSVMGRLYYYAAEKPNGAPITVANTSNSTGKLKDHFSEKGEDICLKGILLPPDKEIYVYIIKYKLLNDGEAIQPSDIVHFKTLIVDSSTDVHKNIWTTSPDDSGLYSMVVDVDANGRYNEGIDIMHQFKIGPPCKVKIDNPYFTIPNDQTRAHHIKVKNNWVPEDKLPITLSTVITNPGGWTVVDGVNGQQINIPPGQESQEYTITVTNNGALRDLDIIIKSEADGLSCDYELYDGTPADDHIGDHPDDCHSISNLKYPNPWLIDTDSKIGILLSGWGEGLGHLLGRYNISTALVKPDLTILGEPEKNLNDLSVLLIGSAGLTGYDNSPTFRSKLANFVENGGTLIVFTQQHGYEFNALPGGNVSGYGWLEDQSCQHASIGIATYHPILSGQDSVTSNASVDGYFTKYPKNATILLSRTKNGMPAMLMYGFGNGTVIATTAYTDWAYGHSQATTDAKKLVRDMIAWAKNSQDVQSYGAGDTINIPVNITSYTDLSAEKVVFTLIDPDNEVVDTVEVITSVQPYETKIVNFSWTAPPQYGIYHIDYSLVDDEYGEVQQVHDAQMFAVSRYAENPDGFVYQGIDLLIWATSPAEYVAKRSHVPFTIYVKNNGDTNFNGNIKIYGHEQAGSWWAGYATISNITVPAHSQSNFTYSHQMYYSTAVCFLLHTHTDLWKYIAYCEKGVWIFDPFIDVGVETDQKEYLCGADVSILLNLENKQSSTYNTTVIVRALDSDNAMIFEDSSDTTLAAYTSENKTLRFLLPSTSRRGIYLITAEAYTDGNKIGSGSTYIKVRNYNIKMNFDKPDKAYRIRENMSIELEITNVGAVLWSSEVNLSIPDLAFEDSQYVSLNSNKTKKINYNIGIPETTPAGKHDVIVTIGYDDWLKKNYFIIPDSKLVISSDKLNYSAGESGTVKVENSGGVDTTYNYTIKIFGDIKIYENNGTNDIVASGYKAINFTVPEDVTSGEYYLTVACKDKANGITNFYKGIAVEGLEATVSVTTAKKVYFSDENITVLTEITNLNGPINNANLNTKVYGIIAGWTPTSHTCTRNIMEVAVDDDYVWFGTYEGGVKRYEKSTDTWKTYTTTDGLVNNRISAIVVDGDDIWFGSDEYGGGAGGVSKYNKITNTWKTYTTDHGLIDNEVNCMAVDGDYVWFGTGHGHGASRYDKINRTWQTYIYGNSITSIAVDGGYIWFGTRSGVKRYEKSTDTWKVYTTADGLAHNSVSSIAIDGDYVWFGVHQYVGVSRYNKVKDTWKTYTAADGLASNNIDSISVDGNYVWFGTLHGVSRYDKENDTWQTYTIDDGLANSIHSIAIDSNYVWFGTADGISKYDKNTDMWQTYPPDGLTDNYVSAVTIDGDCVWFGSTGYRGAAGVSRYNKITDIWKLYSIPVAEEWVNLPSSNEVKSIVVDGNYVWFAAPGTGMWSGGRVARFDKTNETWQTYNTSDGLANDGVHSIALDGDYLWFATLGGGVSRYDKVNNTWKNYTIADGLVNDYVYFVAVDGDYIWFGTYRSGVSRYNKVNDSWKTYTTADGLGGDEVRLIAVDGNYIWFATTSDNGKECGVSKYNKINNSWRTYTTADGLASNSIASIAVDDDCVWFGTSGHRDAAGASRYDKKTDTWQTYITADGLVSNNVISIAVDDESIWFGTDKGANRFQKGDKLLLETNIWETNIPVNVTDSLNLSTDIGQLDSSGKFYVQSILISSLGQTIARDINSFYITNKNTSLTLETDKHTYKPNETITIYGEVKNNAIIVNDYNFSIKKNGEEIFSATFTLSLGEIYNFNTSTTSNVPLTLEGTANDVVVTDFVKVEPPTVDVSVITPDVVGIEDFDIITLVENIGDVPADLKVSIENNMWDITIPGKESKLIESSINITKNTTLTVNISGDVDKTIQKEIICGENAKINITPQPTHLEGTVEIPYVIENVGLLDSRFNATFSIDNQNVSGSFFVPSGENIANSVVFNLTIGSHLLKYTSPFEEVDETINVLSPPEFIVTSIHPEDMNFTLGQNVTMTFIVENIGGTEGEVTLRLLMPDFEDMNRTWIRSGEQENMSFSFVIPDDLEETNYKGIYEFDGKREGFTFFVQGAKISVDANLDKNLYEEGETAILTLDVTNECPFDLSLYTRIKLSDYEEIKHFNLTDFETLQFDVPVHFNGQKLFYGIYMESGRALYLNDMYAHKKEIIGLYTDKQVYNAGENVTIFVDTTKSGTLNLTAPEFNKSMLLTDSATIEFGLPEEMRSGTYYIEYDFDNFSSAYPFDVTGYSARILECSLDKEVYDPVDIVNMKMNVEVNQNITGVLKTWIYNLENNLIDTFETDVNFQEGENKIALSRKFSSDHSGIHVLGYGIYAPDDLIFLASGAEYFDVMSQNTPSSITNLHFIQGPTWLNWAWLNPLDPDFNHTEIYLNGTFQTITSAEFFNATDLTPSTEYTISTCTVDTAGNINQTWVNDTAATIDLYNITFLPPITTMDHFNLTDGRTLPIKFTARDNDTGEFIHDDTVNVTITNATGHLIAFFTNGTGTDSVRINSTEEQYIVNFHTKNYDLNVEETHTIYITFGEADALRGYAITHFTLVDLNH